MELESYLKSSLVRRKTIVFYRASGKHGFLSNLYKAAINFEKNSFPTSEHAYQYGKFNDKEIADWVMNAPKPHLVAIIAHGLFVWDIIPNWSKIKLKRMEEVLRAKFNQNIDLKQKLLLTKDARLVEGSKSDAFWGSGSKGKGKNNLGKLLMKIREELKNGV